MAFFCFCTDLSIGICRDGDDETIAFCKLTKYFGFSFIFPIFAKNKDMAENNWSEKGCECMVKEDYAQAKAYFEKALEEGNAEAHFSLVTF